jgi:hypothetical protein
MATWDSTYNTDPAAGDLVGQGDDEIRATRQEVHAGLQLEMDWGDDSLVGFYTDSRVLNPGAARIYIDTADPGFLQKIDPTKDQVTALTVANSAGRLLANPGGYLTKIYGSDGTANWRALACPSYVDSFRVEDTSDRTYGTEAGGFPASPDVTADPAQFTGTLTTPNIAGADWRVMVHFKSTINFSTGGDYHRVVVGDGAAAHVAVFCQFYQKITSGGQIRWHEMWGISDPSDALASNTAYTVALQCQTGTGSSVIGDTGTPGAGAPDAPANMPSIFEGWLIPDV